MTNSMIDTHIRRGSNSRNSRSSCCTANKIHNHHNLKQSVLKAPIRMQHMVAIKITLLCGIAQSPSSSSKAFRKTKALQVSRGRPARDLIAPLPLQTCMFVSLSSVKPRYHDSCCVMKMKMKMKMTTAVKYLSHQLAVDMLPSISPL